MVVDKFLSAATISKYGDFVTPSEKKCCMVLRLLAPQSEKLRNNDGFMEERELWVRLHSYFPDRVHKR